MFKPLMLELSAPRALFHFHPVFIEFHSTLLPHCFRAFNKHGAENYGSMIFIAKQFIFHLKQLQTIFIFIFQLNKFTSLPKLHTP